MSRREQGIVGDGSANRLGLAKPALLREQCLVAGVWRDAGRGGRMPVVDPATGETIALVPKMDAIDVRSAIEAATEAWPAWRRKTAKERGAILRRWSELMLEDRQDLARILTAEQGKPLTEAVGEILYAASFLEWFAEEGRRVYGDVIPPHQADRRILVLKEPIGVCAAITPWNFPAAMLTRKVGAALAAGCTMVAKPASATPLTALALGVLAQEAGLPPGVLNIVTGPAELIGAELTANPLVRKVTFTGSTEVGRQLLAQCASTVKKVSLELGGNAPFIVFADADLEAALEGAMASKFRNAGQTCVCANRLLVQDAIYDTFAERLAEQVGRLTVGDGRTPGVAIGPLINAQAVAKVEDHLQDAISKGARVLVGGGRHPLGGLFMLPTVLVDVDPTMKVFREETFGPLAPVFRFRDEEEAIRMANDTEFGLAAYVYTRDVGRVWRVVEALEFGIVGVNTGLISTAEAPFGGYKASGMGREGSKYGIEAYLEVKYVCLGV